VISTGCADSEDSQTDDSPPDSLSDTQVDVDLTTLNATMLSAYVTNIHVNSSDYLGKSIKVSGLYNSIYLALTDSYFHYVITLDGDECCQEGFEFIFDSDYFDPDDYPPMRSYIEVIGILDTHTEFGYAYARLIVTEMRVLS
jgi:hypothetical protein